MSEEKNTIKVIDDTIKAVENINEVLKTSKAELIKLENDKEKLSNETKLLENEKQQLEGEKNKLEAEKNELETDKKQLEQDKTQLEEETKKLEQEKQERDQKIGSLTEEQLQLLKEYEILKVELNKLAKASEEAEESEFNFERVKALLSIYAVLIEEIWQGQPHYKIYSLLHGEKEEMTREEIKNTTGIGGAFVLRSVQELANVDLLEYDEETSIVKLKRRLFKKEDLSVT